jgi:hypothetical protein
MYTKKLFGKGIRLSVSTRAVKGAYALSLKILRALTAPLRRSRAITAAKQERTASDERPHGWGK